MFISTQNEQLAHIKYMEELKAKNRACREKILRERSGQINRKDLLPVIRKRMGQTIGSESSLHDRQETPLLPNYFSPHRVAVYTCVIGDYDRLNTPLCTPNNIDYFVITDRLQAATRAQYIIEENLSDIEQTRWYKMHPHLLFPDHQYSIYLDGNITPVTDLTEFIHRIGPYGIATHQHYYRNCVHQEAQAILERGKETRERIERHLDFMTKEELPQNYGLADCAVIARRHHDPFCIQLMEQWWKQFLAHSKRDQMSFPYILFKNGVKMKEVTTLGSNRMHNDALYISEHLYPFHFKATLKNRIESY